MARRVEGGGPADAWTSRRFAPGVCLKAGDPCATWATEIVQIVQDGGCLLITKTENRLLGQHAAIHEVYQSLFVS